MLNVTELRLEAELSVELHQGCQFAVSEVRLVSDREQHAAPVPAQIKGPGVCCTAAYGYAV